MTFDEMVQFVRTHADTDDTDAPLSSLTVYARIAYNDILSRRSGWPHLDVAYTLTTEIGEAEYPLSALSVADLDRVTALLDTVNNRRLIVVTQTDADWLYGPVVTSGTPLAWANVGTKIVLYPTPSAVVSLTVRGARSETVWPTVAGSIPDLPTPFHEAIAWYMLSSYYMAQEDTAMAGVYLNEYEGMVARHLKGELVKKSSPKPKLMGGNYGPARRIGLVNWN